MSELPTENGSLPTPATLPRQASSELLPNRDAAPLTRRIDERIANAVHPREAAFYTQVRGEIIRQNAEDRKELELLRVQRRNFWFRIGSSAAFLVTGTGLIIGGFALSGFFIVGGSLALVAPDYVKTFVNTVFRKERSDE